MKSSKFCSRCAVAVEMFDVNGREMLVIDPKWFRTLVGVYRQTVKFENAFLDEAFGGMECGAVADSCSTRLMKGTDGCSAVAGVFRIYTFVTIPFEWDASYAERKSWCKSATLMILQNFRDFIHGVLGTTGVPSAIGHFGGDELSRVKQDASLEVDQVLFYLHGSIQQRWHRFTQSFLGAIANQMMS